MKTIIVATDFSPAALNAANYAADMALAINANLLLLHMYQMQVIYYEVPVTLSEDGMMEQAEERIGAMKEQLNRRTNSKLNISTEVRMGGVFPELKAVCEKVHPYAVVMGSQGTTATERLLFGGHVVYGMKHLTWPLITVPPAAAFLSVKKIGLACDFDKIVDTIPVKEIKKLAQDFNAELYVLNTTSKESYNPEAIFESAMLQELLGDVKPNYQFINDNDIDKGIIDFAEKNNIDLLVVIPKRHGLLENISHRSHTKRFVLHSHVPVMALHQ